MAEAESVLRALASNYGGDPAADRSPVCFACLASSITSSTLTLLSFELTMRQKPYIALKTFAVGRTPRSRPGARMILSDAGHFHLATEPI